MLSKPNQIHLVKCLLLLPLVIGMLFSTPCQSQDETQNDETSKLSEEELYRKINAEFEGLSDAEVMKWMMKENKINRHNYLHTRDEYIETKIGVERLSLKMLEKAKSENDLELVNSITKKLIKIKEETYQDYLLKKDSQESIDKWQNSSFNGVIKLLVKDLDNITDEEQKLIDSQMLQIINDEFYHTQVISDGLRHKTNQLNNGLISENGKTEEISFAAIDEAPIYPGCDTLTSNDEQKKCFSENINKLVAKNFNLDLGKSLGFSGRVKMFSRFTINKEGNIVDMKARAPHPELEKEIRRVISLIPQLKTGKQGGKPMNVSFTLPIQFNIQE